MPPSPAEGGGVAAARARVPSIPLSLSCVCESKIRLQFDLEPGWV